MNLVRCKSTKILMLNVLNQLYKATVPPPEEQSRLHKMLKFFKQNCSAVFYKVISDLFQAHAGVSNEV